MARIFLLIFINFIVVESGLAAFSVNEKKTLLKQKIDSYLLNGRINESIPYLEKFLEIEKDDFNYHLLYAKALLLRDDLPAPAGDVFAIDSGIKKSQENYAKAAGIFAAKLPYLLQADPENQEIGRWYFLWALAEYYAGNPGKSIVLFEKSVRLDFTLVEAWYNIGSLYSLLGKFSDSEKHFRIYIAKVKELEKESWPK